MAKIITNESAPQLAPRSYSILQLAILGFGFGLLYFVIFSALSRFVDNGQVAGSVAAVLTATIAAVIMVLCRVANPLLVAISTLLALWGLSGWLSGLVWIEGAVWSAALYSLSYSLFSYIARLKRPGFVVVISAIIIIAIRVIITL